MRGAIGLLGCVIVAGCGSSGGVSEAQSPRPARTEAPVPSFNFGSGSPPLLPDLQMERLTDFFIAYPPGTQQQELRFTVTFANTGAGPLEAFGSRPDASAETMTTLQRVYRQDGTTIDLATPAVMFYAGDGHNHWHVRDWEAYDLVDLATNDTVVSSLKSGFCFYDNADYDRSLPGAPAAPAYHGCGKQADLSVRMGVSVGYADSYHWTLPNQYIDITGLGPGHYRLTAVVNPNNWFAETSVKNNTTWVDLDLAAIGGGQLGVTILGDGPSAPLPASSPSP